MPYLTFFGVNYIKQEYVSGLHWLKFKFVNSDKKEFKIWGVPSEVDQGSVVLRFVDYKGKILREVDINIVPLKEESRKSSEIILSKKSLSQTHK